MKSEAAELIGTLRKVYESLAASVENLNGPALTGRTYCSDWTIADLMSHLGSGAEIFELMTEAGLNGQGAPAQELFVAIWDKWNARSPEEQVVESLAANDLLLGTLEGLTEDQLAAFHLAAFGLELDASGLFRMRLSETSIHAWDLAVVLDDNATIEPDALPSLLSYIGRVVERSGKASDTPVTLKVTTSSPDGVFALSLSNKTFEPWTDQPSAGELTISAEAFIRLVYGRLDEKHTPQDVSLQAPGIDLDTLRSAFPGF